MGRVTMKAKVWMLENIPKKRCRYCHSKENLTYDHKIPIIKGGKTEQGNIQVLCRDCNQMKSGMTDGEVKQLLKWAHRINKMKEQKLNVFLPDTSSEGKLVEVTYIKDLDQDRILVLTPEGETTPVDKSHVYSEVN